MPFARGLPTLSPTEGTRAETPLSPLQTLLGDMLYHPGRKVGAFIIERDSAIAADKLKFRPAFNAGNRKSYAVKITWHGGRLDHADRRHALMQARHGKDATPTSVPQTLLN